MTISELKRAMDRRFDRLERTKVDKGEFRKAITSLRTVLRGEIVTSAVETRRYDDATADRLGSSLRDDIAASAAGTRGYVDATAARLRDDIASSADGLRSRP